MTLITVHVKKKGTSKMQLNEVERQKLAQQENNWQQAKHGESYSDLLPAQKQSLIALVFCVCFFRWRLWSLRVHGTLPIGRGLCVTLAPQPRQIAFRYTPGKPTPEKKKSVLRGVSETAHETGRTKDVDSLTLPSNACTKAYVYCKHIR